MPRHRTGYCDSRLIPEPDLQMPAASAMLHFSDSDWHFGFEGAVQMANTYPDTQLLHHWGSVDAPAASRPVRW